MRAGITMSVKYVLSISLLVETYATTTAAAIDDQSPTVDTGYRHRNDLKLPAANALCRLKYLSERAQKRADILAKMIEGNTSLGVGAMKLAEEVKSEAVKSANGLDEVLRTHCKNPDRRGHHFLFSYNCDKQVSPITPPNHQLRDEISCDAEPNIYGPRGSSSHDMRDAMRTWDELKPTSATRPDDASRARKEEYDDAVVNCKTTGYSSVPCTVSEKHWRSSFDTAAIKLRKLETVVKQATGQGLRDSENRPQGVPRGIELGLKDAHSGPTVQLFLRDGKATYSNSVSGGVSFLGMMFLEMQVSPP